MPIKIDGKKIALEEISALKQQLNKQIAKPSIKIILIGHDLASEIFVSKKNQLAESLSLDFELKRFKTTINEDEVLNQLRGWQKSKDPLGVMLQLPIPKHLNQRRIIAAIRPKNDVDGLRFCAGFKSLNIPPVVMAIKKSLDQVPGNFANRKILVIGQGFLVGNPAYKYLRVHYPRAQVEVVGREGKNRLEKIKKADVLVGAASVAEIVTPEMIKDGVILIDAGSVKKRKKILGNFTRDCYQKSSYYTPVPGGIGPLTVAMLYKNLINYQYTNPTNIRIK